MNLGMHWILRFLRWSVASTESSRSVARRGTLQSRQRHSGLLFLPNPTPIGKVVRDSEIHAPYITFVIPSRQQSPITPGARNRSSQSDFE